MSSSSSSSADAFDGKSLRQWLLDNEMMLRSGDTRTPTHLMLNGGRIQVPDGRYTEFLARYAHELKLYDTDRRWWSLHECATRFSRLYFDLDIEDTDFTPGTDMNKKCIELLVCILQKTVLSYFPTVQSSDPRVIKGRCIVLAAPTKVGKKRVLDSDAPDGERIVRTRKTGLHVVFPFLRVDLNQALEIRQGVLRALSEARPPPSGQTSWDDVVDKQVYVGSAGLRMPGSDKWTSCKHCRNRPQAKMTCRHCVGEGGKHEVRSYVPIMSLKTDGTLSNVANECRQDHLRMVRLCTIRQPAILHNIPVFHVPDGAPMYAGERIEYAEAEPKRSNMSWANAKKKANIKPSRRGGGGGAGGSRVKVHPDFRSTGEIVTFGPDDRLAKLFEVFIGKCTYPQYAGGAIRVTQVRKRVMQKGDRFIYTIKVAGDSSRFCQNIGREHSSSTVYFYANALGLTQRCFSKRDYTGSDRSVRVPCDDFESDRVGWGDSSLGLLLKKQLFPYLPSEATRARRPFYTRPAHPDDARPTIREMAESTAAQAQSAASTTTATRVTAGKRKARYSSSDNDNGASGDNVAGPPSSSANKRQRHQRDGTCDDTSDDDEDGDGEVLGLGMSLLDAADQLDVSAHKWYPKTAVSRQKHRSARYASDKTIVFANKPTPRDTNQFRQQLKEGRSEQRCRVMLETDLRCGPVASLEDVMPELRARLEPVDN